MAKRRHRYLVVLMILGLAAAACSSVESVDDAGVETTMAEDMEMEGDQAGVYEFGDPMEASTASRTIEVVATDDFRFSPASVSVTKGETVTFSVTNEGAIPHDFILGDEQMQDEHEAEMAEMGADGAMHDEPNVFVVEPGETKAMTWHMTESGQVLFGCHQPGHYAAGMKGTISVSG
jgi:uncharacterized cupredoxin-like copper-binding protein